MIRRGARGRGVSVSAARDRGYRCRRLDGVAQSTAVSAHSARNAAARRSASMVDGDASARSAGAPRFASTCGGAVSARNAAAPPSARTAGCAASASSAVARPSASTTAAARSARSAAALRFASTRSLNTDARCDAVGRGGTVHFWLRSGGEARTGWHRHRGHLATAFAVPASLQKKACLQVAIELGVTAPACPAVPMPRAGVPRVTPERQGGPALDCARQAR